ncbi:MAG: Ig-like domain-containing protein [Muribaculaceae bacterium]|nr:Ig-like domain-containing protein [Muribaculaceae bacterium]
MKKLFLTFVGLLMLSVVSWAAEKSPTFAPGSEGTAHNFNVKTALGSPTTTQEFSTATVDPITLSGDKASGGNAPSFNGTGADVRFYAGNTFTVSTTGNPITKIVFNISAQGVKRQAALTPTAGTMTQTYGASTATWEGSASSVTFTLSAKADFGTEGNTKAGQFCFESMSVYYTEDTLAPAELMFSTETATAYLGKTFTEPLLSYKTSAAITFSSSNTAVATVNETTGIVTVLAEGTTTIKASSPANDKYEAGEASYVLTVSEAPIPEPTPDPSPLAPGVSAFDFTHPAYLNPVVDYPATTNLNNWLFMVGHISLKNEKGTAASKPELVVVAGTSPELHVYGGNVTTISAPEGLVITGITITSKDGDVPGSFSVNTGKFTVDSSIKWTGRANEVVFSWLAGSYGGEIARVSVEYALDTKDANVAFATAEKTIKVGETYQQVATADTTAPLTYSSSNTAVATVAADGTVTAVAAGTAVITASAAENEEYKAGSASYTITVEELPGFATLAAWIEAKPAKESPASVTAPVTAVYQNGKDLYINEGNAWILVYGDVAQTYTNGDKIPAGINGYYDAYNGQIEFVPTAGSFAAATAGTAVEPSEVKAADVVEANSCHYVKLVGVKVVKDEAVTSGRQYTATDADGTSVILWNRWNSSVTVTEGDNMTVTGFVGMNKTVPQINIVSVVAGEDPGPGPEPEPGEYINFNVKTALGSPTETQVFTTATVDPITLSGDTASGGNDPSFNGTGADVRFYAGNTFTVSTTGNAITKIVFNFSLKGVQRQAAVTPTTGAISQTVGAETATWEGNASSITFTVGDKAVYGTDGEEKAGQFDFLSMYVYTGTEPGPGPGPGPEPEPGTTATFNFNDPTSLSPAQSCTVTGQEGAVNVDGITFTSGIVTLLNEKGTNSTPPRLWKGNETTDPELRVYQGGLSTIAVPSGSKITKIEFNVAYESTGYVESIDGGSTDQMSYNGKVGTWSGEAQSLTFHWCKYTSGEKQYSPYIGSIVVTYEEGQPGPGPGPEPEPEEGSLAAWLAAKPTSPMAINAPVTAVYQNGKDLYINQDNAWILVYGDVAQTYVNGSQIPAGIQGTYDEYNGQPEFVPVASTFAAGSTGTPLAAKLISAADVTKDLLCQYVRIEGVTITATGTDRQFTVTDETGDLVLWNRWSKTVTVTEGTDMTVYGFVGILVKDGVTTLQIYPTLVEGEGPGPEPGPTETTVTFNFNDPTSLNPAQSCTETGEAGAVNVTDITFSAGPVTLLNEIGTNKTNPRLWKNGDYDPHLRVYAGNLTTIATSVGKIVNVTLNSVYAAEGYVEALDGGSLSEMSYSGKVGQWNGEAQKLVFHWCKYTSGETQYSPYFNSISVTYVDESGIEQTIVTNDEPVEYYTIQGLRIANPAPGQFVIRRQGNNVSKILWK